MIISLLAAERVVQVNRETMREEADRQVQSQREQADRQLKSQAEFTKLLIDRISASDRSNQEQFADIKGGVSLVNQRVWEIVKAQRSAKFTFPEPKESPQWARAGTINQGEGHGRSF